MALPGGYDQRADAVRLCTASAGLVLIALNTATFSQERALVRISVRHQPRPVAAAVLQTEQHFGYVVTYEDVTYMHPDDIVDVTEQVRRDSRLDKRVLVMRSGTIELDVTPHPGRTDAQVGEVLNEIIARSRAAGNTGDYRAERVDGGYHVVPIAARGKSGAMEAYQSLLATPISMPARDESALEMISRLVETIAAASGRKLGPGMIPVNRFHQTRVRVEARNERARDVLWRALQSIDRQLSWQLLCGVGEDGCALNIHPVAVRR